MVDTSWTPALAGLALALLLAACSPAPSSPDPGAIPPPASQAATAIPEADPELLQLAREAMAAGRLTQPAQGNAVDYYLALAQRPAHAGYARTTLVELLPYVVLAAERALSDRDPVEAARLVAQLEAIDPAAPALPRIHVTLREVEVERATAAAGQVEAVPATAPAPVAGQDPAPAVAATRRLAGPGASPPPAPGGEAQVPEAAVATTVDTRAEAALPAPPSAPPQAIPEPEPEPDAEARPRQLLVDAAPAYPPLARGRGIEGEVVLGFTINPGGRVVDPHVVSADPPGTFERAAVAAATKWRFEPATEASQGSRRLRFQLSM